MDIGITVEYRTGHISTGLGGKYIGCLKFEILISSGEKTVLSSDVMIDRWVGSFLLSNTSKIRSVQIQKLDKH